MFLSSTADPFGTPSLPRVLIHVRAAMRKREGEQLGQAAISWKRSLPYDPLMRIASCEKPVSTFRAMLRSLIGRV
jgi:hypothetical protein